MTPPPGHRGLLPPYTATSGRTHTRNTYDRLTRLATIPGQDTTGLGPEHRRLLALLEPGSLSLDETAAYLALPVSVVKVIVADLAGAGRLHTRAPIPRAEQTDRHTLEQILSGLRNLSL